MEDYNQIQPGIYLGGLRTARNLNELKKLRVSSILTADIVPLPGEIISNMKNYLHIKINDNSRSNLIENLDSTYNFIQKCLDQKSIIYIHCVAGISRSSSILIAYFMKSRKLDFKHAFDLVSKKRIISPNDGFREQLILYGIMNYNLDINCGQYRIFQLNKLTQSVNQYLLTITNPDSINNLKLDLNNYLIKFHDISKLIKPKIIFKCKKCRLYLFRDINILTNRNTSIQNSSTTDNSDLIEFCNNIINSKCGNIYVEPLIWMNEISQLRGNLICKNCFSKLGKFSWLNCINCSDDCVKHLNIVPSFKIDAKKIDHHIL